MTNVVSSPSASFITDSQIGELQELLAAILRKSSLLSDATRRVLETQGDAIAEEMFVAARRRIEAMSGLIVRRVKVDRTRTPQEALDATGRKQFIDRTVVNVMPRGEGDEVEVFFFNVGRYIEDDDLQAEFDLYVLKPADPYMLAGINEADRVFANEHPNCTHWKDADGNWCYLAFDGWYSARSIVRDGYGYRDDLWFAGVPK